VTCRQQDTTIGLLASDQSRNGGSREDRVLTENNVLDTVTGSELEDDLNSLGREVSSITTDNESLALWSTWHGGQGSLNEVLGVIFLLEDLDSLSQARGSGLLARVRLGRDGLYVGPVGQYEHRPPLIWRLWLPIGTRGLD
jgi:hypothetical protein